MYPLDGNDRIPAQLMYDWLAQLAVPPIAVTELRRALPVCAMSAALPDDDEEKTIHGGSTSSMEVPPEGKNNQILRI